jgi:signal transduction histidine kinase
VKASNSDGVWNETGLALQITILPPWWETLWFRALAAFLLVGAVVVVFRLRIKSIMTQKYHLEQLVGERTSELEAANKRLQEFDRLKSLFIASMSHELRTPLNSIIGFTGILLQGLPGPLNEEQKTQLGMVRGSSRHLLALINDVIDVSKIEAEKIDLVIEDFDLSQLITDINSSFEVAIAEKELLVYIDKPAKSMMRSDERRVKQIIMNMVSNAVKYTDKGVINIKLVQSSGKIEISVKDSGVGIRASDLPRLFKQFARIMVDGQEIHEGTGLGLYLSQKLANLLGGEIRAESEFGKGSEFTLTLPLNYKGE